MPDALIFQVIPYQINCDVYIRLLSHLPGFSCLDSGKDAAEQGRFDILTALPVHSLIELSDKSVFLDGEALYTQTLRQALEHLFKPRASSHDPDIPFTGGVIGYFSYEWLHETFHLDREHRYATPLVQLNIYQWALINDHKKQRALLVFQPECEVALQKEIADLIKGPFPPQANFEVTAFTHTLSKDSYIDNINKIKTAIYAGDYYQINFTQRFDAQFKGSKIEAYIALRNVLSGPFSAYIDTHCGALLSLSPERFIKVENQQAMTQPIKGTAPRSANTEEDAKLKKALTSSEKNRAENLMIVDLLRNDFSQRCKPGSVKTPKLFELQSFANVHHLVSTVTGELPSNNSPLDLLESCFPGGSITGAPKKRAMQTIDHLEQYGRSVYCGAIGYWSFNNTMDMNIPIRTLLIEEEAIYCWGGGGIVADSDPYAEYEESLQKVSILMNTLSSIKT